MKNVSYDTSLAPTRHSSPWDSFGAVVAGMTGKRGDLYIDLTLFSMKSCSLSAPAIQ